MRQRESGAEGSPYGRGFRSRNRITGKEKVFGRSFDTVTLCEPEPGTPPPPYPQTTTRLPQPTTPGCAARVPEGGRPGAPHPSPRRHALSVPCASTGQSLFQLPKGLASAPAITARERPDLTPLPHTPCRHGVRKETLQVDQVTLWGLAVWQEMGKLGSFRGERSPPSGSPPTPLRLAWDHIGWIQLSKSLSNTYNKIQCQTLKTWDRTKTTMNKIC